MNVQYSQIFPAPPQFFLLPVGEVENFINAVNNCDDLQMMGITAYNGSCELKKQPGTPPPPSSSTGSSNQNPNSQVVGQVNIIVCEKVIFKRVHENITKVYRDHERGSLNPLSDAERLQGPPAPVTQTYGHGGHSVDVVTNQAEINEYNNRLRRTPLTDQERQAGPPSRWKIEERNVWKERESITPVDPTNPLDAEPAYGASDRQAWREREQVRQQSEDTYGHWWVEIYTDSSAYSVATLQNSYGWWPTVGLGGAWETIKGVPGQLNYYPGSGQLDPGFDPHSNPTGIDWTVDEAFHPVIISGTEDALITAIRAFATSYDNVQKTWAFPAGPAPGRSNCQKFQDEMISDLVSKHNMTNKKHPIDRSKVPGLNTTTKPPTK